MKTIVMFELQCKKAGAAMEACEAAMEATAKANESNTYDDHTTAARLHRVASEHSALEADDAAHQKHKDMAVDHDMCASRCLAAAQNKVSEPNAKPGAALARRGFKGPAALEASLADNDHTIICKSCNHQFDLVDGEKFTRENVPCPNCGERVNVASSRKEDFNEDGKPLPKGDDGSGVDKLKAYESKAAKAYKAKAEELVAARLTKSQPLQAALADSGWSINDLRDDVQKLCADLDVCKPKEGASCGPCCWACDIVAPAHEAGETWTAIVQGNDGKIYAVSFTVEDDVELVGDPKEVQRVTDYDYVGDIETEARRAAYRIAPLECYNPEGINQYTKGGGSEKNSSAEAEKQTHRAWNLSTTATATKDKSDIAAAKAAHSTAAEMHTKAAADTKTSHPAVSEAHEQSARSHAGQAKLHDAKAAPQPAQPAAPHTGATSPTGHESESQSHSKQAIAHADAGNAKSAHESAESSSATVKDKGDHRAAADAHFAVSQMHSDKADALENRGKGGVLSDSHVAKAQYHEDRARAHLKSASSMNASRETIAVQECLQAMKAEGIRTDVAGLRHEVLRTRGLDLTESRVIDALNAKFAPTDEAIEAANPEGHNQYTEAAGAAEKASAKAYGLSRKAQAGFGRSRGEMDAAEKAHYTAANLHNVAAHRAEDEGNQDLKEDHEEAKAYHRDAARRIGRGRDIDLENTPHLDQREGSRMILKAARHRAVEVDATPNAAAALDASAGLTAAKGDDMRTRLEGDDLSDVIMYMPSGIHRITPSQGGKPVTVVVKIDASAAEAIEEQRQALTADGNKPFFSVQHSTQIAAFWPEEFFWDKRLDATGSLVEGVWAKGEWTKSGRDAVVGKDFRTFSPTFFVDAIRNDEDHPARVVCNAGAKLNMGALENDPAFQSISPLWAGRAGVENVWQAARRVHGELKRAGANPTLSDVRVALEAKGVKMSDIDVGRALTNREPKEAPTK